MNNVTNELTDITPPVQLNNIRHEYNMNTTGTLNALFGFNA